MIPGYPRLLSLYRIKPRSKLNCRMRSVFVCVAAFVLLSLQSAEAAIDRLHLGSKLTAEAVTFRVYSARATRMEVDLFTSAIGSDEVARVALNKDPATSVWSVRGESRSRNA
jgi:hypothetical protein